MRLHANARTCPKSKALICRRVMDEGWRCLAAAEAAASAGAPPTSGWRAFGARAWRAWPIAHRARIDAPDRSTPAG